MIIRKVIQTTKTPIIKKTDIKKNANTNNKNNIGNSKIDHSSPQSATANVPSIKTRDDFAPKPPIRTEVNNAKKNNKNTNSNNKKINNTKDENQNSSHHGASTGITVGTRSSGGGEVGILCVVELAIERNGLNGDCTVRLV